MKRITLAGKKMLELIKQLYHWNRAHMLADQARMRGALKELWPWYVPLWILPALFVSDAFLNGMRNQRAAWWLIPFGACFAILVARSWKMELRRPEITLIFHFIPVLVLLISAIIWAWLR